MPLAVRRLASTTARLSQSPAPGAQRPRPWSGSTRARRRVLPVVGVGDLPLEARRPRSRRVVRQRRGEPRHACGWICGCSVLPHAAHQHPGVGIRASRAPRRGARKIRARRGSPLAMIPGTRPWRRHAGDAAVALSTRSHRAARAARGTRPRPRPRPLPSAAATCASDGAPTRQPRRALVADRRARAERSSNCRREPARCWSAAARESGAAARGPGGPLGRGATARAREAADAACGGDGGILIRRYRASPASRRRSGANRAGPHAPATADVGSPWSWPQRAAAAGDVSPDDLLRPRSAGAAAR